MKTETLDTPAKKLAWLRLEDPGLPDIYNQPDFRPNGCGPDLLPFLRLIMPLNLAIWLAWLAAWLIPDKLLGLPNFEACGDRHDWDYHVGGDEKKRRKDNRRMMRNMRRLVPLRANWRSVIAWMRMRAWSRVYWLAVHVGGRHYYNYH